MSARSCPDRLRLRRRPTRPGRGLFGDVSGHAGADGRLGPGRLFSSGHGGRKEKPEVAQKVLNCFVKATKLFIDKPEVAQKFVREKMFRGQLTAKEYEDAISNSPFTYDLTVEHIQITTDMMMKFNVGRMEHPPTAADWVKTDLLAKARQ